MRYTEARQILEAALEQLEEQVSIDSFRPSTHPDFPSGNSPYFPPNLSRQGGRPNSVQNTTPPKPTIGSEIGRVAKEAIRQKWQQEVVVPLDILRKLGIKPWWAG